MPTTDKPALLIVDDNPDVRSAVEDDVRGRYGERYDVVPAGSAAQALEMLADLHNRQYRWR